MNRFSIPLLAAVTLVVGLFAGMPAEAQQGQGRRAEQQRDARQSQQGQRDSRPQPQQQERERQPQRRESMSPEDRQQLRRDISDHGRDIYRDRPGRR